LNRAAKDCGTLRLAIVDEAKREYVLDELAQLHTPRDQQPEADHEAILTHREAIALSWRSGRKRAFRTVSRPATESAF
jgi:hypothetical protein